MAPGVHITIPRPPCGSVIYEFGSATPDRLSDIGALQADVGQKAVIQLAQLLFSMGAGKIGLDLAHKARSSVEAVVADGFAAHVDRRHFSFSSSVRRQSNIACRQIICAMHNLDAHLESKCLENKRPSGRLLCDNRISLFMPR